MPGPLLCALSLLPCAVSLTRPEPVEGRAGVRFDKLSAHRLAKEVGHTSCFFASGTRRYVGDRLARCNPQGDAAPAESARSTQRAGPQPTPRRVVTPPSAAIPHRDRCDAEPRIW